MKNLLDSNIAPARGFSKQGSGLVGYIIGMVISILIVMALLPGISTFISNASLTGTNSSIASLLITGVLLVVLIAILGPIINL